MLVELRGRQFETGFISEFHLMPMMELLGSDEMPEEETDPRFANYMADLSNRMGDPTAQSKLAFTLTAIFPDLDSDIAQYDILRYPDYDRVKFQLNITSVDLFRLFAALTPELTKLQEDMQKGVDELGVELKTAQKKAANTRSPAKGMAPKADTAKKKTATVAAKPARARK